MKKNFSMTVLLVLSVFLIHCGLGSDSDSGSGSGGTATAGTTATVASNLAAVSSSLTPDSLDYSENSASAASVSNGKAASSGNPCAGTDLFGCQPVLLQLYLEMAQMLVDVTQEIVTGVGSAMGNVADGASGTVTWGGDVTVQYSRTTATDFSIILIKDSTPAGYVDVAGSDYTIKMDIANIAPKGGTGKIQAEVTYTSADSWDIVFLLTGMACNDNDARAPERIEIQVAKAGTLWTGKAMFYNGRWLSSQGNPTCQTTASDALSMNFYTDFVASDIAARASVYMMPSTKNDLLNIASWGMDSFPTNFSNSGFGNSSAYKNSFCNPAGTLTARWNDNCSTDDPNVSAASYSSPSNWVLPSDFYQLDITIPSGFQ